METTELTPCPEWHFMEEGLCLPIMKTYKEWVEATGIGEMIPYSHFVVMSHQFFIDTVNSVLKDINILKEIKEEYCKVLEESQSVWNQSPIERLKEYQHEFNKKMAELNKPQTNSKWAGYDF